MANWLGIDFGTSNSAASYAGQAGITSVELEVGKQTIPTAVFFDFSERKMLIGSQASDAYIAGDEGRYMRSLKSVLGTSLMKEKRQLLDRKMDFYDIISEFLMRLKGKAEQQAGRVFDHVVAGRPVYFHSQDLEKNSQANDDLELCFHRAGFSSVEFVYEPVAAALSSAHGMANETIGLVVDIGGGTSDFTLFRRVKNENLIITSNGLRLGGTDIDKQVSFDHFMPLLGCGHLIKRRFAEGQLSAPVHIYSELATWQKIPFLYNQKTIAFANSLKNDAVEPGLFSRLVDVLEMRSGHDLAFLAEATKIKSNQQRETIDVDLGLVEAGLSMALSPTGFNESTSEFGEKIAHAIADTLAKANISASDVQFVIPVGGSSLMNAVQMAIEEQLAHAHVHNGAIFTSIVDGLAMKAQKLSDGESAVLKAG